MKTIVVASRKGGSGKTTTVRHLAVAFSKAGKRVLLIDTDSQGTLTSWHARREELEDATELTLLQVDYDKLAEAKGLAANAGFDILLIDTPSKSNDPDQSTVMLADFVLIPTKASPDDISSALLTRNFVKAAKIPYAFLVNEAAYNSQLLPRTLETLSEFGNLTPTQYSYVAVPTSMIQGSTVLESASTSRAVEDIERLYTFICSMLNISETIYPPLKNQFNRHITPNSYL